MKTLIAILILSALFQVAFIPINLVLLILISRSLITPSKTNLTLAFVSGLILSLLTNQNLGFYALIFVIFTELIGLLRESNLSANPLVIVPVSFGCLAVLGFLEKLFFGVTINFNLIISASLISLVIYLLVRFWEERFIPNTSIKLKIK